MSGQQIDYSSTKDSSQSLAAIIACGISSGCMTINFLPYLAEGFGNLAMLGIIILFLLTWLLMPFWTSLVQCISKGGIVTTAANLIGPISPIISYYISLAYGLCLCSASALGLYFASNAFLSALTLHFPIALPLFGLLLLFAFFAKLPAKMRQNVIILNGVLALGFASYGFVKLFAYPLDWQKIQPTSLASKNGDLLSPMVNTCLVLLYFAYSLPSIGNILNFLQKKEKQTTKAALSLSFLISLFLSIAWPVAWMAANQPSLDHFPLMQFFFGTAIAFGSGMAFLKFMEDRIASADFDVAKFKSFNRPDAKLLYVTLGASIFLLSFPAGFYATFLFFNATMLIIASIIFSMLGFNSLIRTMNSFEKNRSFYTAISIAFAMLVSAIFSLGFQGFGIPAVAIAILMGFSILGYFILTQMRENKKFRELFFLEKLIFSLSSKLALPMLLLLVLISLGYTLAIEDLNHQGLTTLATTLSIIFTMALILAIFFTLIASSNLVHVINKISKEIDTISAKTLGGLSAGMEALSQGRLVENDANVSYEPLPILTKNELGGMIGSLNRLQEKIIEALNGLNQFSDGLRQAKDSLDQTKANFEKEVLEKNEQIRETHQKLERATTKLKAYQERLAESEKVAAIGVLVASVAHEINTPLGICVTGVSQLIEQCRTIVEQVSNNTMTKKRYEDFIENLGEAYKLIDKNIERAKDLVVNFKEIGEGNIREKLRRINLLGTLKEISDTLKPVLHEYHANIEIKCPADLQICSYPAALHQILTILVNNALIHAYDKLQEPKILIEAFEENGQIFVICQDFGKGMPSSIIDKIFDMFYTTKGGSGCVGLGLDIAKKIVIEQFKGSIICESEIGKGSKFILKFAKISELP